MLCVNISSFHGHFHSVLSSGFWHSRDCPTASTSHRGRHLDFLAGISTQKAPTFGGLVKIYWVRGDEREDVYRKALSIMMLVHCAMGGIFFSNCQDPVLYHPLNTAETITTLTLILKDTHAKHTIDFALSVCAVLYYRSTHQLSKEKMEEDKRLRDAFNIRDDYQSGASFDREAQEARREEREKKREETMTIDVRCVVCCFFLS